MMSIKDIISPFSVWKRAAQKPWTIKDPINDRPGAENYRGFHKNDFDKCVGCGTCEDICQNAAIDLMPVEGVETDMGDSGLRPMIDYGRCCWCALCVDVCPTSSLTMSNDYTWVTDDPDEYRFVPGADKKKWDDCEKGYKRADNFQLIDFERIKMNELGVEERSSSFIEMVKGYSKEQAIEEAERCLECGICVARCPAHMDIPEYIKAIREDDIELAVQILYKTNPFSASCGRVCTHHCEDVCSLVHNGEPIAIRWLKRYILDQVSPEEIAKVLKDIIQTNNKKVAIVGAGPGGLSAAYYLRLLGYEITIFEGNDKGGGMLRYGIPEYRLPYDQLDKDINYIASLGVEIKYNTRIGENVKFDEIYNSYDALFISPGLWNSIPVNITGEELPNVISGIDLLNKVTNKEEIDLGNKVAVIGGGNSAMDAARTAKRLGAEVEVCYRRRIEDMPADVEEIVEAQEENVKFFPQTTPLELKKDGSRIKFVWGKNKMEHEEGKRPKPVLIKGETFETNIDTFIIAIGQNADLSFLTKEIRDSIETKWGKIIVNDNGQTNVEKVFSGGDASNSKADAVSAIADGHKAAVGIDKYLNK